jgi:hypothetical protein
MRLEPPDLTQAVAITSFIASMLVLFGVIIS